jgi:hypothetical protein
VSDIWFTPSEQFSATVNHGKSKLLFDARRKAKVFRSQVSITCYFSAVDCVFKPRSGQTKYNGTCPQPSCLDGSHYLSINRYIDIISAVSKNRKFMCMRLKKWDKGEIYEVFPKFVTCYLLSFWNLDVNPVHFLLIENIKRGNQGIII